MAECGCGHPESRHDNDGCHVYLRERHPFGGVPRCRCREFIGQDYED